MSTQLILGVAGAAIGSFFGMPQLGFVVGSLIGSLLDPPKTQGPRLGDLKLQQSTYGKMIPYVWGTGRLAGNLIDQTDLEEHKQKSGGKGGPQVTNYTYSASFDIMLCGTPVYGTPAIQGILRIWADGRLIWDSTNGEECPCTVYLGSEDQLPDPTFEAIHGVGEVPAYRGYAHCVFTDYYLTDFGNRIPAFEFEVFTGGGEYPWQVSEGDPWFILNSLPPSFEYTDGVLTVTTTQNAANTASWQQFDLDLNPLGAAIITGADDGWNSAINSNYWLGQPSGAPSTVNWWGFNTLGFAGFIADVSVDAVAHPPRGNQSVVMDGVWYGASGAGTCTINRFSLLGAYIDSAVVGAFNSNQLSFGYSDTGDLYVVRTQVGASEMWKYDNTLTLVHHWSAADLSGTKLTNGCLNFLVYQNQVCFCYSTAPTTHWAGLVDIDPATFIATDSIHGPLTQPTNSRLGYLGGGLVVNGGGGIFSLSPPPGAALLSTIVGNLTDMTPAAGSYDVSELTDEVRWFVVGAQMTVRNALQTLRQCFFFDAVESDDVIKYRKRSEVSTFEIPDDDLCGRGYGESSGEPLRTFRTREQGLPRTVTITYIDVERDYQIGTQSTPRQTTLSQQDTTVEVPVGLNADEAMQKCWSLITAAWVERESFEWSTTRKWAHLEPCDVGLIRGRVIRIQTRTESPNGVIKWTGVLAAPSIYASEESSIYFQPATGAPSDGWVPPSPPASVVATRMVLMDLPLLLETDYPNGPYCAVGPASAGSWPGCEVYKSSDGGTTYASVGSSLVSDTMGTASGTLGNFTGGNNFDEMNLLEVVLDDATNELDSVSEDAVLNGANRFAIGTPTLGWEIAQFKTATLISPGQYELSGLLRGRYGTERLIGSHGASETFVMLPPTININGPAAEINATRKYKAVTFGTALADATAQDFINTGVAVKPYAPVNLEGGRDASGNLTINWIRRTRIGGVWLENVEVPLSEAAESYRVKFYTAAFAAEVSYYTVSAATTVAYSAVNQAIDFGSPQASICVGVAQVGSYGLGYEIRATL